MVWCCIQFVQDIIKLSWPETDLSTWFLMLLSVTCRNNVHTIEIRPPSVRSVTGQDSVTTT